MTYTALPNEVEEVVPWKERHPTLITKMIRFSERVKIEDFVGMSFIDQKTQYKKKHKAMKKKGGSPPFEFSVAETMVDFKLYLEREDYGRAIPLYFYLKKLYRGER